MFLPTLLPLRLSPPTLAPTPARRRARAGEEERATGGGENWHTLAPNMLPPAGGRRLHAPVAGQQAGLSPFWPFLFAAAGTQHQSTALRVAPGRHAKRVSLSSPADARRASPSPPLPFFLPPQERLRFSSSSCFLLCFSFCACGGVDESAREETHGVFSTLLFPFCKRFFLVTPSKYTSVLSHYNLLSLSTFCRAPTFSPARPPFRRRRRAARSPTPASAPPAPACRSLWRHPLA